MDTDLKWVAFAVLVGAGLISWQLHAVTAKPTVFAECVLLADEISAQFKNNPLETDLYALNQCGK